MAKASDTFLNFLDRIDGGGKGQSGNEFEGGGLLSEIGNALFRPYGYRSRMEELGSTRPQSRPTGSGAGMPLTAMKTKTSTAANDGSGSGGGGGGGGDYFGVDAIPSDTEIRRSQAMPNMPMGLGSVGSGGAGFPVPNMPMGLGSVGSGGGGGVHIKAAAAIHTIRLEILTSAMPKKSTVDWTNYTENIPLHIDIIC